MKKTKWPGNWKVTCDVCGFWFPSGEVKKRWDGLIVCDKDYEERHPSTLYKYHEHPSVPSFVRKDPLDTFVLICDLISVQARAEYGTAGCATVGRYYDDMESILDLAMPSMAVADITHAESE